MTNYIKNINGTLIGGKNFDGSVTIFTSDQAGLITSDSTHNLLVTDTTLAANDGVFISVSTILPNDGYNYEICLSVYAACSTSGKFIDFYIQSGSSYTTLDSSAPLQQCVTRRRVRTSASYNSFQVVWVPIFASDKYIRLINMGDGSSTYNVVVHGYRRLGTNDTFTPVAYVSNLGDNTWISITYGNNKFVALSDTGYISISTDGVTWTAASQVSNLGSRTWRAITYGNNKFVALSSTGYISTSTDGTTWTAASQVSNLGNNSWASVAYGNSKFVALSSTSYISTSTDGTTWTVASKNTNLSAYTTWVSIVYVGGSYNKFFATSYYGYVSDSTDGTTWSTASQSLSGTLAWQGRAVGNLATNSKSSVIIGNTGYVVVTLESSVASEYTVKLQNKNWRAAAYGNSRYIVLSQTGYISTIPENYISNISTGTSIPIGGDNFDGQWVLSTVELYSGTTFTASAAAKVCSLSSYLPNDSYDYMIYLSGTGASGSSSGNNCTLKVMSGTKSRADITAYGYRYLMSEYHSTSTYTCAGSMMIPILASDRNVSVVHVGSGTTGSCNLHAVAYRRIGKNE